MTHSDVYWKPRDRIVRGDRGLFLPFVRWCQQPSIADRECNSLSVANIWNVLLSDKSELKVIHVRQCFSTAGPWHQLYRAARGSSGICHFCFLSIFMSNCFIVEIFWGEKYSRMCRKIQTQMLAWGNYNMLQHFISPVFDN